MNFFKKFFLKSEKLFANIKLQILKPGSEIMLLKNSKDQFELYHCAKYLKRYKD